MSGILANVVGDFVGVRHRTALDQVNMTRNIVENVLAGQCELNTEQ